MQRGCLNRSVVGDVAACIVEILEARPGFALGRQLQVVGPVPYRERPIAGVEEETNEVEVGGGYPAPSPSGSAAVVQMGIQLVPPDAAADGEASEARNWGRDLQPVVKLVATCMPAQDDAVGGSPAAPGDRGDRGSVVVAFEALYPHNAGITP